jgi:hypothetical protein
MTRRQEWFDLGCEAFKRSFPDVVKHAHGVYVCPLCGEALSERCLTEEVPHPDRLTEEDVPPKNDGGKPMLLTCGRCNSTAGYELDCHLRKESDIRDFLKGNLREVQATLRTDSGAVPIRLSLSDQGIKMHGPKMRYPPPSLKRVVSDFEGVTLGDVSDALEFTVEFERYSPSRAAISLLRSAYLAFFAAFGYRFIVRPEMEAVRALIANPEIKKPGTFRMLCREYSEPILCRIKAPEAFRSYAMRYKHSLIFLPLEGDQHLFDRLAALARDRVKVSGQFLAQQYPWPDNGPLFLDDLGLR